MNKEKLKEWAATLNGIADGKAWEYCSFTGPTEEWFGSMTGTDPLSLVARGRGIRLKPWSLPPPPDGMQWHRGDWTEEMLPEGYRPLLLEEEHQLLDEYSSPISFRWNVSESYGQPSRPDHAHRRTKRPLPQPDPYAELKAAHAAGKVIQCRINELDTWDDSSPSWYNPPHCYRIKPEQQKVPLGPSDVPPGTVLRKSEWLSAWQSIFGAYDRGVSFNGALWEWNDIIDTHQINRSIPLTGKWNPEAWEPCYKLIDTP